MSRGRGGTLGLRGLGPVGQSIDELIEEDRQVVAQLGCGKIATLMLAPDLVKPAVYDLGSLRSEDFS